MICEHPSPKAGITYDSSKPDSDRLYALAGCSRNLTGLQLVADDSKWRRFHPNPVHAHLEVVVWFTRLDDSNQENISGSYSSMILKLT